MIYYNQLVEQVHSFTHLDCTIYTIQNKKDLKSYNESGETYMNNLAL